MNRSKLCEVDYLPIFLSLEAFFSMHCWKTINLEKNYGYHRIFLISFMFTMIMFSLFYSSIESVVSEQLYDKHFYLFVAGIFLVYPIHKVLHLLPILTYIKKVKCKIKRQYFFVPIFNIQVVDPIPKRVFFIALMSPFFLFSVTFTAASLVLPHYTHYFTILIGFHSGICAIDFIYVRDLHRSPKHALIEESDEGYEILVIQ
jgi:hypothetical protein